MRATRAIAILCLTSTGGCAGVDAAPSHHRPVEPSEAMHAPAPPVGGASFGFARGSTSAPLVVLEFSDFGCFYCASFARSVLPEIAREYIATGRVRWQLVPLATAATPHARAAAAAAVCAGEQELEQAWAMHDRLFEGQRAWTRFGDPTPHFVSYARGISLDVSRFAACRADPRTREAVEAMYRLSRAMNVRVAPTFFLAGRRVEGAIPIEEMRVVLDAALAALQ